MRRAVLLLVIGLSATSATATPPPVQGPPPPGARVPSLPVETPPLVAERVRTARERQALVDEPIERGRRSGQLSRREAKQLRKSSTVLADTADRYMADGRLSDAEAAELRGRTEAMHGYIDAQRMRSGAKRR